MAHRDEDKCCCSSSSLVKSEEECAAELPEDVLVDILGRICLSDNDDYFYLRADNRDLIKLKTVSKFWNHVISRSCIPMLTPPYPSAPFWGLICFKDPSPGGERDHRYGAYSPITNAKFLKLQFLAVGGYSCYVMVPRLVREQPTIEHHLLSLIPALDELERDPCDIRDCCNGLILIMASEYRYYVGNPVTKQRLSIPPNPNHTKSIHRSSLVFDPSLFKNPVQFKIVSFICPAENHQMELDIFCSETWEWSSHVLPLNISLDCFELLTRPVYFDGALYSMSSSMYLICIDNIIPKTKSTSGVDLRAWAIELPDKMDQTYCGCIGNSLGCFYYSNRHHQRSSILVWMLVLKGGPNSEWVLTYSISIKDDIETPAFYLKSLRWKQFDLFRPCGFCPNDNTIFIATPELVFSYHLKTKRTLECYRPAPWQCNRKTIHLDGNCIFPFSPCLLLLNNTVTQQSRQ